MATIEVTLKKERTYELEPYGKFVIKFLKRRNNVAPRIIPFMEVNTFHDESFPLGDFEDKFVKLMKKHKTDIWTDGSYNGFYTRTGSGMTRVWHEKLAMYRDNEGGFKDLIDGLDE
jgi:hypothetical protein